MLHPGLLHDLLVELVDFGCEVRPYVFNGTVAVVPIAYNDMAKHLPGFTESKEGRADPKCDVCINARCVKITTGE